MRKVAKTILTQSSLGGLLGKLPGMKSAYDRLVWRRETNLFSGAFSTYDEAMRACPPDQTTGWDHGEIAKNLIGDVPLPAIGRDRGTGSAASRAVQQTSAFAVLVWLHRVLRDNARVLDMGGAGGLLLAQYRRYFDVPDGLTWVVVDEPSIVARGKEIAEKQGIKELQFATNLADVEAADIVVASGVLQYLSPEDFGRFCEKLAKAETTIINKLPLVQGAEFWTLQNIGASSVPYWIANERDFIERLTQGGGCLIDSWTVPELSIEIPFHPSRRIDQLTGLVFSRE